MTIKARNGRGQAIRTLEDGSQDMRAAEMRSLSMTYQQIGEQLGMSTSGAYYAATRGLKAVPTENAIEAKRLELAKLDNIERRLLPILAQRQPKSDHGRVIWDIDDQGNRVKVVDYGPVISAATSLLRVQARRSALLGLDAPQQIRVTTVTEDEVDAEIRRLEAKLSQNDPKESVEP
jgi:hypothetical protein